MSNLIGTFKVGVVCTEPSGQLPDPLADIELGTIGWQEIERESLGDGVSPRLMKLAMMIFGVIDRDDQLPSSSSRLGSDSHHKIPEGLSVERALGALVYKHSIAEPDSTKITNTFSCRAVEENRISIFGRDPHAATRAMELEMDLVSGPQIDLRF